jgi:hypothetical protein
MVNYLEISLFFSNLRILLDFDVLERKVSVLKLNLIIISASNKERFLQRIPDQVSILFYGETADEFHGFIDSCDQVVHLCILDSNMSEYTDLSKKMNGNVVPFTGDYGIVRQAIDGLIHKHSLNDSEQPQIFTKQEPEIMVKEKRIKETIVRDREIIRASAYSMDRKLVLVGSCDRGAGSSFMVRNLAHYIADMGLLTSIVEFPISQPYHFDRSLMTPDILKNMSRKEEELFQLEFVDIPGLISKGKPVSQSPFIKQGVIYAVSHPDFMIRKWTIDQSRRVLGACKQSVITLIDVGTNWKHPAVRDLFYEADEFVLLLPSEPARLERLFSIGYAPNRTLKFVFDQGKDVSLIFNPYIDPPNRDFLKMHFTDESIKQYYYFPFIAPKVLAESASKGDAEYLQSEELKDALQLMAGRWFPTIGEQNTEKTNVFKSLFNKLINKDVE